MQYLSKDDLTIQIKAIYYDKDGTKAEAVKGKDGGMVKTLYFYDVADTEELATLAQYELERLSYNGYDGAITTFLEPRAMPTMIADITDKQYPERDGKYYIEAVETTFGTGGGRHKVTIGQKI